MASMVCLYSQRASKDSLQLHRNIILRFESEQFTIRVTNIRQRWWDEALDAASGNFFQSNMWDDAGFGGNSAAPDNCATGPFFGTMHVGPTEETTGYCFMRDWNYTLAVSGAARSEIDACYAHNNYQYFWKCLIAALHVAGLGGTGGVVTDGNCSPGDPVFFMNHSYLDHLCLGCMI